MNVTVCKVFVRPTKFSVEINNVEGRILRAKLKYIM
jgi:hypothetical protein